MNEKIRKINIYIRSENTWALTLCFSILKIIELSGAITSRMREETNKTWPALMLNMGTDGITQLIPLVTCCPWRAAGRACGIWPVRAWGISWRYAYKHF
jgi:hypothetical protein